MPKLPARLTCVIQHCRSLGGGRSDRQEPTFLWRFKEGGVKEPDPGLGCYLR